MKKQYWFIIGFFLVLLDQASKILLTNIDVDYGFFALNYTINRGISFGLFQGSTVIISVISVIVLVLLYYYRKEFKGKEAYLTLIVAGIIGNLIDRVVLGYVRDFLDLKWWPVFNVADSLMFIGVFGLVITYVFLESKGKKEKKINKSPYTKRK